MLKYKMHSNFFMFFLSLHSLESEEVGTIINSYQNYNTFEYGNLNIIITLPHMGYMTSTDIAERQNVSADGTPNTLNDDLNTKYIVVIIRDELMRLFR